jgi:hypothetical protein
MPNNLVFNGIAKELQVLINGVDSGGNSRPLSTNTDGQLILDTVTVTATDLDIRGLAADTDTVSVGGTVTVTATDLDIRGLAADTDTVSVGGTVTVTATDLDIRGLAADTDTVSVGGTVTVTATDLDIRGLAADTDTVSVGGIVTVTATDLDIRALAGDTDSIQLSSRMFTSASTVLSGVNGSSEIFIQDTSEQSMYSFYVYNTGTNTVTVNLQISPTENTNYFVDDGGEVVSLEGSGKTVLVAKEYLHYTRLAYDTGGATCTFEVYYNAQV